MKGRHPLITHPVGRMQAPARWYMAAMAMLTLVLVAIHFAMQVFAQEEAKRLVAEWQKRSDMTVGDVRYRMLRGALTLIDVRYAGKQLQARLPVLFLQGNLSSLSGASPRLSAAEIRGGQINLTLAAAPVAADDLLMRLWEGAQRVSVYQTKIHLNPAPSATIPGTPTRIELVRMEDRKGASSENVDAVARLLDGEVKLNALWSSGDSSPPRYQGSLQWRGIDAARLLSELAGLQAVKGRCGGKVDWESTDPRNPFRSIDGRIDIAGLAASPGQASLSWRGGSDHGRWHGEINAVAWPLSIFAGQLPGFDQFGVAAGRIDGALQAEGDRGRWRIGTRSAQLTGLRFHRSEESGQSFADWNVASARLGGAELGWPERRISIAELALADAMIVMVPGMNGVSGPRWQIGIEKILLNRLIPGISLNGREVLLPPMQGEGSLSPEGNLKVSLASAQEGAGNLEGEKAVPAEQWKLSGEGLLYRSGDSGFSLDMQAKRAPLVRFRSLMPEPVRNGASDLSGDVTLTLRLHAGAAPWQASGEASVTDASLQYDGDTWQADRLALEIERIGEALPMQLIRRVEVDGGSYQAALRPLSLQQSQVEAMADPSRAEPWHIRALELKDGRISVGQIDAVWMDGISARIDDLYSGNAAPFRVDASLGSGALAMSGTLMWNSAMPSLAEAKITLRDALPFFANEWLSVSYAPKIVRGRLYADIRAQQNEQGDYSGTGYLRLQNGQLGPALSADDPLLLRVGMNSHDVFAMLHHGDRLRLTMPVSGKGPLINVLGESFVASIKAATEKREFSPALGRKREGSRLSSVRLHEADSLSQNERTRLRTVLKYMNRNPKSVIELKPLLSITSPLEEQSARATHTQRLIEAFLTHRGIARSRIFPVWPLEQHRSSGSTSGVNIVTIP